MTLPLSPPQVIQDSFSRQAGGDENRGDARAGMRAGADEVQITVAFVPVVRTHVSHLRERVTQSMGCAFEYC